MERMIDRMRCEIPEGLSDDGQWKVQKFEITEKDAELFNLRERLHGTMRLVEVGEYTRLMNGETVVMSDTPAELREHADPMRQIEQGAKTILINGLGLGCLVRGALSYDHVQRVDVVEIEPSVIELVGPHLRDDRLNVIEDDALTAPWPKNMCWDVVWHDIWATICGDHVDEMSTLHRRYGRRAGWQGSWLHEEMRALRRESSW